MYKLRFDVFLSPSWFEADEELVFTHLKRHSEARSSSKGVLHLGCGTSTWCELLEDSFPNGRVTHVDVSEVAVNEVKTRLPDVRVECADARSIPFEAGEFDMIVDKGEHYKFIKPGWLEQPLQHYSRLPRMYPLRYSSYTHVRFFFDDS
jgi:hypothetical protein